ncbi:hypothetical protein T439DRAFT_356317 [Meredithblackwellia eburnea MCA 4105]
MTTTTTQSIVHIRNIQRQLPNLDTYLSDPGLGFLAESPRSRRRRPPPSSGSHPNHSSASTTSSSLISTTSPLRSSTSIGSSGAGGVGGGSLGGPNVGATGAGQAIVSTSTPLRENEPTPTDLLLSTPPAILKLLTLTSPVIQSLTTFVQLVTWTHPSFFSSLLVLLAWWAICLFGRLFLLYGVNGGILAYVVWQYVTSASSRYSSSSTGAGSTSRSRRGPATLTPASYTSLLHSSQLLASHVHTLRTSILHPIASHFSFSPLHPGTPVPAYSTAWLAITSYPFYLLLTYFVPLNLIFLVIGSVGILWNAPFFKTLRTSLTKSAFVRWVGRLVLRVMRGEVGGARKEWQRTKSGVGIPGLLGRRKKQGVVDEKPVKSVAVNGGDEAEDVQLQFTVFENQRWWMGLDWTHALLPGERASWTDASLNPSSPPASFALPPPSVTYTPSPTKADPHSRIKLTTEWKWIDPEWKVHRSGSSLPVPGSPTTASPSAPLPSPSTLPISPSVNEINSNDIETLFLNWAVDDEGWQYGDNHFEKMGPKGGLGKYTRRRAWVRKAGLVERSERVSGSPSSTERDKDKDGLSSSTKPKSPSKASLLSSSLSGSATSASSGVRRSETTKERSISAGRSGRSESPVEVRRRKSSGTGSGVRASSQPAAVA